MKRKIVILSLCFFACTTITQAQITSSLNSLLPTDLIDPRGGISRSVAGMDFMVRILLYQDIKNTDACYDADFGRMSVEIMWYDPNTELGKTQIEMIKLLNAAEQQKVDFLGKGDYIDISGGSMVIETKSKPCINTISGETGEIEHSTTAKFFMYNGAALVKISYQGKVKSAAVTDFISQSADAINIFDYSVYKNIVVDEQE